jgi:dienelactone hydrolase
MVVVLVVNSCVPVTPYFNTGARMSSTDHLVAYHDADTPLTGVLYGDDPQQRKLPGILLIHGGAGIDEHARQQGRRWATLGYVVFVCDMCGDGVAGDRQRVMERVTALRDDPSLLARRAQAGLDVLRERGNTSGPFGAVGYCFGGMAALTLARAGAAIAAAISIHGSLTTPEPAWPGAVAARVLVCHGSADPHVPLEHVIAFAKEMDNAQVDWQLIMYGGAMHGFTHEHAQAGATPGVAYQEHADRGSFKAASQFLAETMSTDTTHI